MAEAGLAGYAVDPWFGVYAPANTDKAVITKLNAAINQALADATVQSKLVAAGFTPKGSTAEAFEQLTQSEYQRLGDVARKAKMQAE